MFAYIYTYSTHIYIYITFMSHITDIIYTLLCEEGTQVIAKSASKHPMWVNRDLGVQALYGPEFGRI